MLLAPIVLAAGAVLVGAAPAASAAEPASGLVKQVEITASDGVVGDDFADAVALGPDGRTAIVGAYGRDTFTGAAYVFVRNGSQWTQTAELTASDGVSQDAFGSAVAITGRTAVVGAYGRDGFAGAVYIFTRHGSVWTQTAELSDPDGAANDLFGADLSLGAGGKTLVVGAQGHDNGVGAAYVYTKKGGSWPQTATLTASGGVAGDYFGSSVALGGGGRTAVVGADGHAGYTGAAYVFERTGSTWSQSTALTASDAQAFDQFGQADSLSANGRTVVIGAYGRDQNTGVAYVFARHGSSWTQAAQLSEPAGVPNDLFSRSVSIGADGDTVVVGAQGCQTNTGAAFVYTKKGGSWALARELTAFDGVEFDYFGTAVAVAAHARTGIVSSEGRASHTGAAYLVTHLPTGGR